jgi:hypothetical protein
VGLKGTCRSIAERFYGDEGLRERVYRGNERVLKARVRTGTDRLPPGTEGTIRGAVYGLGGPRLTTGVGSGAP